MDCRHRASRTRSSWSASPQPLVHGAAEHPLAPGLYFIGYEVTLGGAFRLIGIQAKQLARAVAA
jgi:hypothetical protein